MKVSVSRAGWRHIAATVLASLLAGGIGRAEPLPQLKIEITGLAVPAEITPSADLPSDVLAECSWHWESGGIWLRVVQVRMRRPYTMAKYLRRWRADHGCAAKEVKDEILSSSIVAPQRTVVGSCEGGDFYAIHFVKLDDGFVELHADSSSPDEVTLRKALRGLMERVRAPGGPPARRLQFPPASR